MTLHRSFGYHPITLSIASLLTALEAGPRSMGEVHGRVCTGPELAHAQRAKAAELIRVLGYQTQVNGIDGRGQECIYTITGKGLRALKAHRSAVKAWEAEDEG